MLKMHHFSLALSQRTCLLLMPFALAALSACGREATDDRAATRSDGNQRKQTPKTTPKLNKNADSNADSSEKETPQTPPKVEKETDSSNEPPLIFQKDEGVNSTKSTFRARIKAWTSGPEVTQNGAPRNAFSIEFATASGHKPVSFEALKVTPYMKIHGHGVPRAYLPDWKMADNLVSVEKLGFIMSGPWEIIVQARVNGVEDSVEIPVEVP